jgi:hypothetical protein
MATLGSCVQIMVLLWPEMCVCLCLLQWYIYEIRGISFPVVVRKVTPTAVLALATPKIPIDRGDELSLDVINYGSSHEETIGIIVAARFGPCLWHSWVLGK